MDNFSQGARQPLSFVLSVMGLMGAFIGLFVGPAFGSALIGVIFGATISVVLSYGITITVAFTFGCTRLVILGPSGRHFWSPNWVVFRMVFLLDL
jgi:hypothetical protein